MKTILNYVVIALALAVGTAQAAVIFDINDVVRPGGSGTANTILVGTGETVPTTMDVSGDPRTMAVTAKNGSFVTYFTAQSLAVGETLEVEYSGNFTNADASGNGFRVGLFSSADGTIYTADQASVNANFTNYQGYGSGARTTSPTASGTAFQRGATLQLLSPASATEVFSTAVPGLNVVNGNNYSGNFSITRTDASTLSVEYQFGNQTAHSFIDSSGIVTSYNAFAIYLNNNITGGTTPTTFTMTQMDISVVPEPSVVLLLLPAFVLGTVMLGRRRKIACSSA